MNLTVLDEQRMRRYILDHCREVTVEAMEEAAFIVAAPINQGIPWCDVCSDRHDPCDPHPDERASVRAQLMACRCDVWDRCAACRAAHRVATGRPVDARERMAGGTS